MASNQEFHCPTATKSATVAYTGLQSGEMIFTKIVVYPAPSSCADSSRLSGIPAIYVRMTSILNALTMPGTTYTQKLLVRCRFLYSKKVGIIPPLTYIVTTQNSESERLNIKFFRLTINARIAFATNASSVPIMVLATVIYAPVMRLSFWSTVI